MHIIMLNIDYIHTYEVQILNLLLVAGQRKEMAGKSHDVSVQVNIIFSVFSEIHGLINEVSELIIERTKH